MCIHDRGKKKDYKHTNTMMLLAKMINFFVLTQNMIQRLEQKKEFTNVKPMLENFVMICLRY